MSGVPAEGPRPNPHRGCAADAAPAPCGRRGCVLGVHAVEANEVDAPPVSSRAGASDSSARGSRDALGGGGAGASETRASVAAVASGWGVCARSGAGSAFTLAVASGCAARGSESTGAGGGGAAGAGVAVGSGARSAARDEVGKATGAGCVLARSAASN